MKKIMIFVTLAFSCTNNFAMDAWETCEPIIDDLESFEQESSDELIVVDDDPSQGSGLETQLLMPQFSQSDQAPVATSQEPAYICAEDDQLFENHDDSEQAIESEEIESTSKKRQSAVAIEALAMMPATKKLCTGPTRKCETCHKIISASGYSTHMRIHTGKKPHACPYPDCGQSFSDKGNLTQHVRIHTGEKPFKCPDCSKSFSKKSNLTVHMRAHTGEKPYKCTNQGCQKAFDTQAHLAEHERTHTGEKPYKCPHPTCGLSFKQRSQLKSHYKTVHEKIMPFVCQDCHKAFSTKRNLDVHFQSMKHWGKFTCPFCKIIYASSKALAHHQLEHQTAENTVAVSTAAIQQS